MWGNVMPHRLLNIDKQVIAIPAAGWTVANHIGKSQITLFISGRLWNLNTITMTWYAFKEIGGWNSNPTFYL